jgi:hypothetical protein
MAGFGGKQVGEGLHGFPKNSPRTSPTLTIDDLTGNYGSVTYIVSFNRIFCVLQEILIKIIR